MSLFAAVPSAVGWSATGSDRVGRLAPLSRLRRHPEWNRRGAARVKSANKAAVRLPAPQVSSLQDGCPPKRTRIRCVRQIVLFAVLTGQKSSWSSWGLIGAVRAGKDP